MSTNGVENAAQTLISLVRSLCPGRVREDSGTMFWVESEDKVGASVFIYRTNGAATDFRVSFYYPNALAESDSVRVLRDKLYGLLGNTDRAERLRDDTVLVWDNRTEV